MHLVFESNCLHDRPEIVEAVGAAIEAGLDALEELSAAGVTLNVTLIFTEHHRLDRGATRRQFVDDRHVEISVHRHGE